MCLIQKSTKVRWINLCWRPPHHNLLMCHYVQSPEKRKYFILWSEHAHFTLQVFLFSPIYIIIITNNSFMNNADPNQLAKFNDTHLVHHVPYLYNFWTSDGVCTIPAEMGSFGNKVFHPNVVQPMYNLTCYIIHTQITPKRNCRKARSRYIFPELL